MTNYKQIEDNIENVKQITLCHEIIGMTNNISTPITFGLGLFLHHETGSEYIINLLNSYGVCGNYDEIIKFTTAVAEEKLPKTNIDMFVPSTLSNVNM